MVKVQASYVTTLKPLRTLTLDLHVYGDGVIEVGTMWWRQAPVTFVELGADEGRYLTAWIEANRATLLAWAKENHPDDEPDTDLTPTATPAASSEDAER